MFRSGFLRVRALLVVFFLLAVCSGAEAAITGDFIFRSFLRQFRPEAFELILDAEPDESGAVRHMYAVLTGARYGGIRIDKLSLETVFCTFRSVPGKDGTEEAEIASSVNGYFTARLTEKDLNGFLLDKTVGGSNDESWRKIRVDFLASRLRARGYYSVSSPVSLTALVELEGNLELEEGNRLILSDYTFRVNNADQASLIEDAIRKAQPLLDFRTFVFPVVLKSVVMTDDSLTLATRVPPKRFKGVSFRRGQPES